MQLDEALGDARIGNVEAWRRSLPGPLALRILGATKVPSAGSKRDKASKPVGLMLDLALSNLGCCDAAVARGIR